MAWITPQFRIPEPLLLLGAHPDDETIGAGGVMTQFAQLHIMVVTDGAPRSTSNRAEYAAARRRELIQALSLAGVDAKNISHCEIADQQAAFALSPLARLIAERSTELQAAAILVQPYEGGHPDHDSIAFATRAAVRLLAQNGVHPPDLFEYTSYYNAHPDAEAAPCTGRFLPGGEPVTTISLTPEQRERKRAMFACYRTQQEILEWFDIDQEQFRPAPNYDFSHAPHHGRLFYETQDWGMSGQEWRALAAEAARELNLGSRVETP